LTRRRVLVVVGRDPLYVAGPGSHVDEMIRLAGGANVAHDALAPYQQVSLEVILERMPEVIIDASDNRPGSPRGRQTGRWGEWPFLPAVQDERVYWVDPGLLLIPGLRLPEMTLLAGRLIHPETFGAAGDAEMR
jgi:iron complex transport system substrate-binding protein